jgi:FkbM family methyltransferase
MITKEYIKKLPLDVNLKNRITITTSCNDCKYIDKVKNAGEIFPNEKIPFQLMHNGIKVVLDGYHGRGIREIILLLKGHHEPQEEKVFYEILKHVKSNSVVLELGSHWSYYSLWFNRKVQGAINYLIEPDPSNLEVGKLNFKLNNANGSFHNAFISNKSSEPYNFECESDNIIRKIPAVSVDDFLRNNNIDFLEMLLVDIKGDELKMLEGRVKSIKEKKIRFIFLSTHHHSISHDPLIHDKCLDFLNKHNAHIIVSHTISESFSGDGLVVASFDINDTKLEKIDISRNNSGNYIFPHLSYDLDKAFKRIDELISDNNSKNITINEKKKEIEKIYNEKNKEIEKIYTSRSWRLIIILKKILSFITFNKLYK